MIIIDENIAENQCAILRAKHVHFKQISRERSLRGIDDRDIIPMLHQISRPTFFTRDDDFDRSDLCHSRYCLVVLDLRMELVAEHVRKILRHPSLATHAKRMGKVVRASPSGLSIRSLHQRAVTHLQR